MVKRRHEAGNAMAETAVSLPVVLVLTFALINFAIAGYASVAAANAANYGARVGSVTQGGAAAAAASAAHAALSRTMIGEYSVAASGGGRPGSMVVVTVNWTAPNYIGSMLGLLGGGGSVEFKGQAQATFRQEGW
ncbi:TadE/TadG family type IV pilus assembly protein [Bellilinea sp.]|uniref:TadE/TadG family type IV pilus assembly protein n=1 Tax=Bellilinea sp. TaxID=2838785 RepID=UPI002ADDA794|nr:TadE/TadG family type IV pilus assembly protein [Bellilinea sp.]